MKTKCTYECPDLDAEVEVTGDVGGNARSLRVAFTTSQNPERQEFEVTGGNLELPEFFMLIEAIKPFVLNGGSPPIRRETDTSYFGEYTYELGEP
jgi:hypothetical protein